MLTISTAKFPKQALSVLHSLQKAGFKSWFVGGCVRDALLKKSFSDIDIATVALPKEAQHIFKEYPQDDKGISFGCVRIFYDNQWIEITTLRHDTITDGRHAKVSFTHNISLDAARRDFTINALYWNGNNEQLDFFQGLHDLEKHCVRFIGNPNGRVTEDYLRILRFFRFSAYYAETLEPASLEACITHQEGLRYLSGERIWSEWQKLLKAPNALYVLQTMQQLGIIQTLFGQSLDSNIFNKFKGSDTLLLTRLLLPALHLEYLTHRLQLNADQKEWLQLAETIDLDTNFKDLYVKHGNKAKELVHFWTVRFNQNPNDILSQNFWHLTPPSFPLSGKDLLNAGCKEGVNIGHYLKQTYSWWLENDFTPTYEACLNYAKQLFKS